MCQLGVRLLEESYLEAGTYEFPSTRECGQLLLPIPKEVRSLGAHEPIPIRIEDTISQETLGSFSKLWTLGEIIEIIHQDVFYDSRISGDDLENPFSASLHPTPLSLQLNVIGRNLHTWSSPKTRVL